MMKDETNPFTLEGLVVSSTAKASPKAGAKAVRKKGELFIKITPVLKIGSAHWNLENLPTS